MNNVVLPVVLLVMLQATLFGSRPNFVLIVADDLGYGDLGCYGSELTDTVNIDRLAAGGLRLTDFHSNGPMCTPTRVALLTGCYQQRFGENFDGALGQDDRYTGLPLEAVTLAEILKEAGYATGAFGKWHLGYLPPYTPRNQGFDTFVGLNSGDGDFHSHIDRSGNRDWWINDEIGMEEGYTTKLLTQHSVAFINEHKQEPFFLYVPHLAIHFPWQGPNDPPHRQVGVNYDDDKWGIIPDRGNIAPHVKAMIEALDQSVGEIVEALDVNGLTNNTLIIFTSDNGGYITYNGGFENISSNGPLKGQKTDVHEGGHRVPCIFHWPGRIEPGRESAELVMSMDFYPTIAQLAGAGLHSEQRLDGVDLSDFLFKQSQLGNRSLFWRMRGKSAARKGPWKVNLSDRETPFLYNLNQDIGEKVNLAQRYPERVRSLMEAYDRWEADVNGGFRAQ
jgi:arylsulfatase A